MEFSRDFPSLQHCSRDISRIFITVNCRDFRGNIPGNIPILQGLQGTAVGEYSREYSNLIGTVGDCSRGIFQGIFQ
jgi:hypothetical protein